MNRVKREGLLIAGGGLAGCLAALAMARARPEIPLLLVEETERFGGNHLWSFFDGDLDPDHRWLVEPLIDHQWQGYYVAFPGHSRKFRAGFNTIRSERLDALVRETLRPDQYRLGARIAAVRDNEIVLAANGETIRADGAIDARGAANLSMLDLGWHKFVGREYRFERPHGVDRPVVMDATVEQVDGYRFVHCLPFDAHGLLVEDTYYSDVPALNPEAIGARIDAYVRRRGWGQGAVEREEAGALPVAIGGDFEAFLRIGGARVAKLGLRGGLFHPATGHALPDAVRTASMLAAQPDMSGAALHDMFAAHSIKLWKKRAFYRSFNAMLFRAAAPEQRYKVMERFYRLDSELIGRFHAGTSTALDRLRTLSARPPAPATTSASASGARKGCSRIL